MQNFLFEAENLCVGCYTGKAQSKQPAASPHTLKLCSAQCQQMAEVYKRTVLFSLKISDFHMVPADYGCWSFIYSSMRAFLIVQEINYQRGPPLYLSFAEKRFSLQI